MQELTSMGCKRSIPRSEFCSVRTVSVAVTAAASGVNDQSPAPSFAAGMTRNGGLGRYLTGCA